MAYTVNIIYVNTIKSNNLNNKVSPNNELIYCFLQKQHLILVFNMNFTSSRFIFLDKAPAPNSFLIMHTVTLKLHNDTLQK